MQTSQTSCFAIRLCWFVVGLMGLAAGGRTRAADVPRPLFVEGYAGRVSYAPTEELTLHVSSSAATFSVEIQRLGGKSESVWSSAAVPGREHPAPEDASSRGCRWPAALTLKFPSDWRSGYYRVWFRARDSGGQFTQRNARTAESSCFFVLRPAEPGKVTKTLLQTVWGAMGCMGCPCRSEVFRLYNRSGTWNQNLWLFRS